MLLYRSLWLGALGAIAALAAVPAPASALTLVFDNYGAANGWASNVAPASIFDYTCIPDSATGCSHNSPGVPVNSIPLGGTNSVSNGSTPGVTLSSEKAQQVPPGPWNNPSANNFWPLNLKTGTTYNGDVWTSNMFRADGSPVDQVTLTFAQPLSAGGFIVNAQGLENGTTFTIAVTGFAGNNTATYYVKERIFNNALLCTVPTGQANQGSFANGLNPDPNECGFFGFKGGNTSSLTISLTDNTSGGGFCTQQILFITSQVGCQDPGIGIGDFVTTLAPANVPEPSSLALLGGGLVGLRLVRRRFLS